MHADVIGINNDKVTSLLYTVNMAISLARGAERYEYYVLFSANMQGIVSDESFVVFSFAVNTKNAGFYSSYENFLKNFS